MRYLLLVLTVLFGVLPTVSQAKAKVLQVNVFSVSEEGNGTALGTVEFIDTPDGLLILPHLKDLSPGLHGFHIHENPSCKNFGKAAGGHFDPLKTGKHLGPYDDKGHLGDLPVLFVDKAGKTNIPVLSPRLTIDKITGHSLMVHADGDNYSDKPAKLGGGGARIACGVIEK
jgi:Cu-Zn family superoxide dismutase